MSTPEPIPLTPIQTEISEPEFQAILAWQFPQAPFYEAQVLRLLREDIPHRMDHGNCSIWVYRDPLGNVVGFGTLDICKEYEQFTGGKYHSYIPVLAVNPAFQRRGHGRSIVDHLTAEAVLITQSMQTISDVLFLDVYVANRAAVALYEKCDFVSLNPDSPTLDPGENHQPYVVMARRVSIASN